MPWTQIWTQGAARTRDRLPLADIQDMCGVVEEFLRTSRGTVLRFTPNGGSIQSGKYWVDFMLAPNSSYETGDGETETGDVCWVVDVYEVGVADA